MSVCEIIPNLWLGNINCAKNKLFFDANNISIVVNCSKDIPFYSNYTQNVRVAIHDNLKESEITRFYKYIDKAVEFIHENLLKGKSILVHCYAGKQRSASIVAGYLIKFANMSLNDSINTIQTKRLVAFKPAVNFDTALKKYEDYINVNFKSKFNM